MSLADRRRIESRRAPRGKPQLAQERRAEADRRLYEARTAWRRIRLRLAPSVQGPAEYRGVCGQTLVIDVPEAIDVWELLRDLYGFLKAWRPMRLRSAGQQVAARQALEQWQGAGAALDDGRWS